MNKVISIILAAVLGLFVIYVLVQDSGRPKSDDSTVTVWHWMTDRDDALDVLTKKYKHETGVSVKLDLFAPSDTYSQKITAASQAKILPDIFGVLDTKNILAEYVKYGYVADLTAHFEADEGVWKNEIFDKALSSNTFVEGNTYGVEPGIYGVPLDVTTIQLLYNKKLLSKAGFDTPPKTFDEFLKVGEAMKRVGIARLVSGWGELWLIDCFASNYAFNIMGEEKVIDTYRGKVPYTDPDWIKVFQVFQDLVDKDMLVEGVVSKPNKEAEQDFALSRSAFAFNGSWAVNVYKEMNPRLEYGAVLPPAINPKRPMKIWGGAGSSFVVNDRSPRKNEAIAFLKWLTQKDQQEYLSRETNNLPSNRLAVTTLPENLEEFADGMNSATHPTIWPVIEQPVVADRFAKGIQAILLKKKSPRQVAEEVQEVKKREMERMMNRRQ